VCMEPSFHLQNPRDVCFPVTGGRLGQAKVGFASCALRFDMVELGCKHVIGCCRFGRCTIRTDCSIKPSKKKYSEIWLRCQSCQPFFGPFFREPLHSLGTHFGQPITHIVFASHATLVEAHHILSIDASIAQHEPHGE
jgi:hypothetical protein